MSILEASRETRPTRTRTKVSLENKIAMTNKWLLCFGNGCALNVSGRLTKYDEIYFSFPDHAEVSFLLPTPVSPAPTHLATVSPVNSTDIGPVKP